MAALTADRNGFVKTSGQVQSFKVAASTTIYKGGGVAVNATGYAIPAADTAGIKTVGVAEEQVDNSSGSNGDLSVLCYVEGTFAFGGGGTAPTQADIGRTVVWEDDNLVTTAAAATNDIVAGKLLSIEGSDYFVQLHRD